jgi:hypothetical protein
LKILDNKELNLDPREDLGKPNLKSIRTAIKNKPIPLTHKNIKRKRIAASVMNKR